MGSMIYHPCKNAPIERTCDLAMCDDKAVVDCKLDRASSWAYLCLYHFIVYGDKNKTLVNNITTSDIILSTA